MIKPFWNKPYWLEVSPDFELSEDKYKRSLSPLVPDKPREYPRAIRLPRESGESSMQLSTSLLPLPDMKFSGLLAAQPGN